MLSRLHHRRQVSQPLPQTAVLPHVGTEHQEQN